MGTNRSRIMANCLLNLTAIAIMCGVDPKDIDFSADYIDPDSAKDKEPDLSDLGYASPENVKFGYEKK